MELSDHGYPQYTKEEIIELVKQWYQQHGKIRIRDLRHKNGLPSVTQVTNIFGTFQECLIESGIGIDESISHLFNRESLTEEELLNRFKKFVEEHLKTHMYLPTSDEVDAEKSLPVMSTIIARYGSFDKIYEMIGYDRAKYNNDVLENDMLYKYKKACANYGHTLSSREITRISQEKNCDFYATEMYLNHFGTLHNLQELCGLNKTYPGKNCTREEMIKLLLWLSKELERVPIERDLIQYPNMPSAKSYYSEFGTFSSAIKCAGLKSTRIYKTKNGVTCRSLYELKLAQVLESYQINFVNEVMYKTVIPNFDRLYRFDFVIDIFDKKYYIELFGITGNEKYEKRKQEKINLCTKYNIPLIELYQEDIYGKTNKEIYENLLEKIQLIKVA